MGVYTFVCKQSGDGWSAKQINDGEHEASGSCTYSLQRNLVQAVLSSDSSGGVQSSFSFITPSSAVFQVIVGGGGFVAAGGAAAAPAGGAAAAAAPAAEEKKEEPEEESEDDLGFSLFD